MMFQQTAEISLSTVTIGGFLSTCCYAHFRFVHKVEVEMQKISKNHKISQKGFTLG